MPRIEKALFAKNLHDFGQGKDVIQQALTIDGTLLSRMLSIAGLVPAHVIAAIGPAKQIGRDRWEDLKKLMAEKSNVTVADRILATDGFDQLDSDTKFEILHSKVVEAGRVPKRRAAKAVPAKRTWTAGEGRIKGVVGRSGRAYNISLTSKDSAKFGEFLSENLDQLYADFLSQSEETSTT